MDMLMFGVSVRVRVSMRVGVVVVMVMSRTMFVRMAMIVLVVLGLDANRFFSRQAASAFFTHQSISIEASSISRPARSSPLGLWQSGHSANISSD